MTIRRADPDDAVEIARIHVAGWRETYRGLLPDTLLDGLSVDRRAEFWRGAIAGGATVYLEPGAGFAAMGAQRDTGLAAEWPRELQALYVAGPAQGRGIGRALLRAAFGTSTEPVSAFVIDGNDNALAFYLATGAVELFRRPDRIGGHPIVDVALGWARPRNA